MSAAVQEVAQPSDQAGKRVATLIAQLALRGHVVHRIQGGGFLVTRHSMHRHCVDVESLEAFARQVGAIT